VPTIYPRLPTEVVGTLRFAHPTKLLRRTTISDCFILSPPALCLIAG
jgi:hypothetical protein